jgi:hypothetical protein
MTHSVMKPVRLPMADGRRLKADGWQDARPLAFCETFQLMLF